jgi:hypothetical protein
VAAATDMLIGRNEFKGGRHLTRDSIARLLMWQK